MTFTNDLDSQLFEFETQIYKQLTHVFTVEAFEDWLYDMECTEWDYYDASSNDWKTALVSKGVNNVLANLLKFQNDIETDAYKKGYIPQNRGADVREWSSLLTEYLL
ncbi:hypothetical protein [Streptococcus gallolyticus]|uniref:hypothetical protein n=1 Tax=Streptococcus gallolyticus TaxID=315405 RepID=UPI000E40E802|nr:hypothetical protein [Streptococcus gallolyticus]RGC38197.1 hypothetical protein DXD73_08605 [Streptococcus gallolyticus]